MAVVVKNVGVVNANISAEEVYVRLSFEGKINGTDINIELIPFRDKAGYRQNLWINNLNLPKKIFGEVLEQNLLNVHLLVKDELEERGFEVTIDL